MTDLISRQAAIEAIINTVSKVDDNKTLKDKYDGAAFRQHEIIDIIESLPTAQPDNQIHLCDSCEHKYPDCPCKPNDVIFGNGKGNDNICACNKYNAFTPTARQWIPVEERLPEPGQWVIATYERTYSDTGKTRRLVVDTIYSERTGWNDTPDIKTVAWMPLPEPYKGEE